MKSAVCFLSFFALVAVYGASAAKIPDRCLSRPACSLAPQTDWATDNVQCFAMRNKCYTDDENCNRIIKGEKSLRRVTKKRCQKLCGTVCPGDFDPVCADLGGSTKLFRNICVLTNYVCNTGETYIPTLIFNCGSTQIDVL